MEAQHVSRMGAAVFDGYEIREARMALGNRINRYHAQMRTAEHFSAIRLEVFANALVHSRCEVSPSVPTICRSPRTLTTFTDVK